MRSSGGFRVVLHRERADIEGVEAFHDFVIQSVVAHLDPPEPGRRVKDAVDRSLDGETVIVRRDLDPSGRLVEHRLVDATVAERQLIGGESECAAEKLIAEADSEERQAGPEHSLQQLDVGVGCFRVARAVGVEHRVRRECADIVKRHVLRQHVYLETARGEIAQGRRLDAQVEHGNGADALPFGRERVRLRR